MVSNSDISSSGTIESPTNLSSSRFSDYEEIPSHGHSRLVKAKRFGRWFILKGLQPEYSAIPFYKELLRKEFELGISLQHPNIVQFFDFPDNSHVGGKCIVMEYVDGMTLSDFLKQNPSRESVQKILAELLSAMEYFHGKQIVHRDLKPGNLLITRNGNSLKVIDFGLSDSDQYAILKQPAGTPKYIAPEQMRDDVAIDCRADIYAFGKIALQCKPFLSARQKRIARACVQHDRDCRPDSAAAISREWKKKRKAALPVVILALALVAGAGAYLLRKPAPLPIEDSAIVAELPQPAAPDTVVVHDTVRIVPSTPQVPKTVISVTLKDTVLTDEERTWLLQSIAQVDDYYQKMEDSIVQNLIDDGQQFILSMGWAARYYEKCYRKFLTHFGNTERAMDLADAIEKCYKKNFYRLRTFENQLPWPHERDSLGTSQNNPLPDNEDE